MPPLPIVYSVRLGRRFVVEGDARDFVADLEEYFRAELDDTRAALTARTRASRRNSLAARARVHEAA
jgi:hypothetical protein